MDRVYQANAIETPPSTTASSGSYPTAGNKAAGQLATVPGPYWFYSITEEIRNALIAAGVTPDAAKVNQLAEAMSKFLPLSGGKLTGAITINTSTFVNRSGDNSNLQINGGSGWGKGASIELYGKDRTTDAGSFKVRVTDGTNTADFMVMPDGTAKVKGYPIITAGGGTMTGAIKWSNLGYLQNTSTTQGIQLYGGTAWGDGSFIGVYGKDHSSRAGQLYMNASDGTNSCNLIGKPDGALTWGNVNIVRSVNGAVADASGNVAISVGTVSQKHTSKFQVGSGIVTKTVTDLVANKPVYYVVKSEDSSSGYSSTCTVTSGATHSAKDTNGGYALKTSSKGVDLGVVIPSGTSLAFRFDGDSTTVTFAVYQ